MSGTNIECSPVGADDARFTSGRRYLVIPENTREPFFATRCSATMPIRAPGTLIPPAYQEVLAIDAGRVPARLPTRGDGRYAPRGDGPRTRESTHKVSPAIHGWCRKSPIRRIRNDQDRALQERDAHVSAGRPSGASHGPALTSKTHIYGGPVAKTRPQDFRIGCR